MDDDLNTAVTIAAAGDGGPAWVQYEFAQPFKARAIYPRRPRRHTGRPRAGQRRWHELPHAGGPCPGPQLYRAGTVRTFAFPETTARFYRVEMTGAPLTPAATMNQGPTVPAREYTLTEAVLHSGARVHRWEDKAGFSFLFDTNPCPRRRSLPPRRSRAPTSSI